MSMLSHGVRATRGALVSLRSRVAVVSRLFGSDDSKLPPDLRRPADDNERIDHSTRDWKPSFYRADNLNPTDRQRQAGKVLEEFENVAAGYRGYADGPVIGAFGTLQAPAKIFSMESSRIVGCVGDNAEMKHPLLWFTLHKGAKHVCTECGQVFELTDKPEEGLPEATEEQQQQIVD